MRKRPTTLPRFRRRPTVWGVALLVGLLFALAAQPALAVVPVVDNLGFESWSGGAPVGWILPIGGNAYASSSPHAGTYAVLLNDAKSDPSTSSVLFPGSTLIPVRPATQYRTYRFAAWAQSDRGAAAPALDMWFTNNAGVLIGSKHSVRGDQFGVTSSTWKQMQLVEGAPFGATKIVVQLSMFGGTGGGVRFDDVELDEVNVAAGTTDVFSGWTVDRSPDMGSGFSVNPVTGGLAAFTAFGGQGYELNGAASIHRLFERPVDTLSFHLTTAADWDSGKLMPIVWSYLDVNGQPAIAMVRSVCMTTGATEQDVTLTGLNTKRIDFTCSALRGLSEHDTLATISNVKAFSPVWRFRNPSNGFYLWSADPNEKNTIVTKLNGTWLLEGPAYQTDALSSLSQSPLWRFLNIQGGYYLYTADPNEKNTIVAALGKTWRLEGEAYKVSTNPSGLPVWRFRNRGNGTYLYTADTAEKISIVDKYSAIWQLEGPAYYLTP